MEKVRLQVNHMLNVLLLWTAEVLSQHSDVPLFLEGGQVTVLKVTELRHQTQGTYDRISIHPQRKT